MSATRSKLRLLRSQGEKIRIGPDIVITIEKTYEGKVALAIELPRTVVIDNGGNR